MNLFTRQSKERTYVIAGLAVLQPLTEGLAISEFEGKRGEVRTRLRKVFKIDAQKVD
jgi:hypothetical protein